VCEELCWDFDDDCIESKSIDNPKTQMSPQNILNSQNNFDNKEQAEVIMPHDFNVCYNDTGVPGPGKYEIKSQFEKTQRTTANANNASSVFLSESERFAPIKSCTPAPGTYNEIRTALKYAKKRSGKNLPFGQSTARFIQDSRAQKMPGPGFYDISSNTAIAKVRNTRLKKPKKTGFVFSLPQNLIIAEKEVSSGPGPCDYQVDRTLDELPNLPNQNAAFLSRTERAPVVPDTADKGRLYWLALYQPDTAIVIWDILAITRDYIQA
ncbi:hypothetical protein STEG23_038373, partial [Scotinomys teguina]